MKKVLSLLLAIVVCLSLWACGGNGGTENAGPSGSDPNGYPTMEAVVDAYMTMFHVRVASKEEFRMIYPEQLWKSGWEGINIVDTYAQYKESAMNSINHYKQRFGDDYHLTWEIVSVEDTTNYGEYTEEDRQECLDAFGVEPEDHHMYVITVSVTGSGSNDEHTNPGEAVYVRKIGNKWYFY